MSDRKILTTEHLINVANASINIKDIEDIDDIENFKKSIAIFQNNEVKNRPIFHYTTGQGLKSIIENKKIWFSKSDFLNDRTEIQYTYDLVEEIIMGTIIKNRELEDIINKFKRYLDDYFKDGINTLYSYSASFSTNRDSNLLWANYSNDEGYNIEFECAKLYEKLYQNLDNCANNQLNYCIVANTVNYDRQNQIELLKKQVIDLYRIFKYCKYNNKIDEFERLIRTNIGNIYTYALFFKSKEFLQEQEFRIVILFLDDKIKSDIFKIRLRKGTFIPYIEVPFSIRGINQIKEYEEIPVSSITISPKNHLDTTENGIRYLFKFNRIKGINNIAEDNIEIKKSNIPYRY